MTNLTRLDLSVNTISDEGAREISFLNLGFNGIGEKEISKMKNH